MGSLTVTPENPIPRTCVEAKYANLQARTGDLPDFLLLGDNYMLFGVYQDWVHQNPRNHLYGGITEDGKWKTRLKNSYVFQPKATTYHPEK